MTDETYIKLNKEGDPVTFVGKGVDVFQVVMLRTAIGTWLKTKMIMTRNLTPSVMARAARHYTGNSYAPTAKGLGQAYTDLKAVLERLKEEVPVIPHEDVK